MRPPAGCVVGLGTYIKLSLSLKISNDKAMGVRDVIARILFPYGVIRRVLRGPLRGYKYIVGPAMGASFALGSEAHNYSFLAKKVGAGSVVFDVGANQGQLSLFFARAVGEEGTVISFEPIGELAERISHNAKLNHLSNVKVVAAAAAGREGRAKFNYTAERKTQGMLYGTEPTYDVLGAETNEVRTVALDVIAEKSSLHPNLMKVDVEGGQKQYSKEHSVY